MPLLRAGEILYTDLRADLVEFRKASGKEQQRILRAAMGSIYELGENIQSKEDAIEAYRRLAYTATLVNYADALYRIDHQQFFDILIDYKMPEVLDNPRFAELKNYFELHASAPQMRLLKPRQDIPMPIWKLFREAQQEKLRIKGTADKFKLDELDIDHLPDDQLYPLPIQMFGAYNNEAVDRVWGTEDGQYSFANPYGVFLLPGGGMIEINLGKTMEKILQKMLDEHFEEQHGNLWVKATRHYNAVPTDLCIEALKKCFVSNKNLTKYKDKLDLVLLVPDEGTTNANMVADAVCLIDSLIAENPADKKLLLELRASVQVEPLKPSPFYVAAVKFISDSSLHVRIEQFGDTRACGGKQLSNSYLMFGNDLLEFIRMGCGGEEAQAGDDITGSKFVHMSLLKAIELHPKVKFSHLLILLAHQIESLERGVMMFQNVWKNEEFLSARDALRVSARKAVQQLNPAEEAIVGAQAAARAALVQGPGFLADDGAARLRAAEERRVAEQAKQVFQHH